MQWRWQTIAATMLKRLKKVIDEQRPDIEKSTRSSAQVMLAFTYRDVSDADLNEYLNTYEDKDGKWVQDFVQAAIEEQFNLSIEKEAKGNEAVCSVSQTQEDHVCTKV